MYDTICNHFCKVSRYFFFAEAGGCETDTFQTEEKNCECYNAKQIEVNSDNKADKDVVRKT